MSSTLPSLQPSPEFTRFDLYVIIFSIALIITYHLYLYAVIHIYGRHSQAQFSRMIDNASLWMAKHKEKSDPQSVTLAIHTLRNTILVAIFVGGNVANFGLSLTNSYSTIDPNDIKLQIRSMVLSFFLVCSFLCWVCVIRFAAQLGYFMGTLNIQDQIIHNTSREMFTPREKPTVYIPNSSSPIRGSIAQSYQLGIVDTEKLSLLQPSKLDVEKGISSSSSNASLSFDQKDELKECTKILIICSVSFR